ncbi:MAG: polyphosphate polymerase domain-containing protein [Myxococcales bacterium]|nr:polyphosphate polymerase domain-containing protein [Myxococcales bacterium]
MDEDRKIERYEAKYRIPVELVEPIRQYTLSICDPDSANQGGRYFISSLYLDNRERRLYRETADRVSHRYKLRVRRYLGDKIVFLEIKRRIKGIIVKSRVKLPFSAWPAVLHHPAQVADLPLSARDRSTVDDFVNRCLLIGAEPAAVVRYEREAFVSRLDGYARVTFDHRIMGRRPDDWSVPVLDSEGPWIPVDEPRRFDLPHSGVVLELKATMAVPMWMTNLVKRFNLTRTGFSKYACCLEAVDPFRLPAQYRRSAPGLLRSAR